MMFLVDDVFEETNGFHCGVLVHTWQAQNDNIFLKLRKTVENDKPCDLVGTGEVLASQLTAWLTQVKC